MTMVVLLLALLGGAALLYRLARGLMRLALRTAEIAAAEGLVEISMRRGDLTGLQERRTAERSARRSRRRDLALAGLWALWLTAPAFTDWAREAYAVAAPLWMLRVTPLRGREE